MSRVTGAVYHLFLLLHGKIGIRSDARRVYRIHRKITKKVQIPSNVQKMSLLVTCPFVLYYNRKQNTDQPHRRDSVGFFLCPVMK